jgi:RNA polymerase sigma-70 factor, ECF subfamily
VPIHRLSDARLVRRSQQGDRDAFVAFLQRYDRRLRGLVYALVTSEAAMDRVLRTAYLRAWREIVRVGSDDDPSTWLYRLAYNGCIDELRHESARAERRPSAAHAKAEEDDPLAAALAALTPEQRLAVVLVDREGFAHEGAARIAGVPVERFEERLAVGRAALVDTLPTAAPRRRDAPGRNRTRHEGSRRRPAPASPAAAPVGSVAAGPNGSEQPGEQGSEA